MSWNLVNEQSQHDQFMVSFGLTHTNIVKTEQIQLCNLFDPFETLDMHIGPSNVCNDTFLVEKFKATRDITYLDLHPSTF